MKKYGLILAVIMSFVYPATGAQMSRYNNDLPSCLALGYAVHDETCAAPLYCPFDTAYSICVDKNCRGFVEKSVLDADYATYGAPEDLCELETCVVGAGTTQARTLYRCRQCKTSAFEAGLCVDYCDRTKFPYSQRPEDLYGQVIQCTDNNGTFYAYASCNNGWVANGVRCEIGSVDRYGYPYEDEPDSHLGNIDVIKAATNFYYGYIKDTCAENAEFFRVTSDYDTGICVKECTLSNCRKVGTEDGIDDYKCDLSDDCVVGDKVMFDGKEIGNLLYKAATAEEHSVVVGANRNLVFGLQGIKISGLSSTNGRLNTKILAEYCATNGVSCPAATYCYNYSVSGVTEPALAQGQWFLGSNLNIRKFFLDSRSAFVLMILRGFKATTSSNYIMSSYAPNEFNLYYGNMADFDMHEGGTLRPSTALKVFPLLAI